MVLDGVRHLFPVLRVLLRYSRPSAPTIAIAALSSVAVVLALSAAPWLTKMLVDEVFTIGREELLLPILAGFLATAILYVAGQVLSDLGFLSVAESSVNRLRSHVLGSMFNSDLARLHGERSGDIAAIFTSDSDVAGEVYQQIFGEILPSLVQLVFVLGIVYAVDWRIGALATVMIPVYAALPALVRRRMEMANTNVQNRVASFSGSITEVIVGARDLRALGGDDWAQRRVQGELEELLASKRRQLFFLKVQESIHVLHWTGIALVWIVSAPGVISGTLTIGEVLAAMMYFEWIQLPAFRIVRAFVQAQLSLSAGRRLLAFMDRGKTPERRTPTIYHSRITSAPPISFKGVRFHYEGSRALFRDLNITARGGEFTAIVGPSGAGKSTIVSMLLGFISPIRGEIRYGDIELQLISHEELRRKVSVVFQDPILFDTSVRENILMGRELSDNSLGLKGACQVADALEFIERLPKGFETRIGERGVKLSGGQAQRIAIARAVISNPEVLVLDEATSSLDSESEQAVQDAIGRASVGRTTIAIAHRLSTVVGADQIIVVDEGVVVDRGRHEELLDRCELYRTLCEAQLLVSVNG